MSESEHEDAVISELQRINSRLQSILTAVQVLNDRLSDMVQVLQMRQMAHKRWEKEKEQSTTTISLEQLQELVQKNPALAYLLSSQIPEFKKDINTQQ